MNDAAETLAVVLDALQRAADPPAAGDAVTPEIKQEPTSHPSSSSSPPPPASVPTSSPNYVERVFGLQFTQNVVCPACGAASAALLFSTHLYYIPAATIASNTAVVPFGRLLQEVTQTDQKTCDAPGCPPVPIPVITTATALPEVLVLGVVWTAARVTQDELIGFLSNLRRVFRVSDLFRGAPDAANAQLTGLVLFYSSHYVAVFRNHYTGEWVQFDDRRVRPLGDDWVAVLRHFVVGHLQPLLLFYSVRTGEGPDDCLVEAASDADDGVDDAIAALRTELTKSVTVDRDASQEELAESEKVAKMLDIFGDTYKPEQLRALLEVHLGDMEATTEFLMETPLPTTADLHDPAPPADKRSPSFSIPGTPSCAPPSPVFEQHKARYRTQPCAVSPHALLLTTKAIEVADIFTGCFFFTIGKGNIKGYEKANLLARVLAAGGKMMAKPSGSVTHLVVFGCSDNRDTESIMKLQKSCKNPYVVGYTFLTDSLRSRKRLEETKYAWKPPMFRSVMSSFTLQPLRLANAPALKKRPLPSDSLPHGDDADVVELPEEEYRRSTQATSPNKGTDPKRRSTPSQSAALEAGPPSPPDPRTLTLDPPPPVNPSTSPAVESFPPPADSPVPSLPATAARPPGRPSGSAPARKFSRHPRK